MVATYLDVTYFVFFIISPKNSASKYQYKIAVTKNYYLYAYKKTLCN